MTSRTATDSRLADLRPAISTALAHPSRSHKAISLGWREPLFQRMKNGARDRDLPFDLSWDQFCAIIERADGRCELTGIPFDLGQEENPGKGCGRPFAPSLDRIDSFRGYSPENCRLVCVAVNIALNGWGEKVLARVAHAYTERTRAIRKPAMEAQILAAREFKAQRLSEKRAEFVCGTFSERQLLDRIIVHSGTPHASFWRAHRLAGTGPLCRKVLSGHFYAGSDVIEWLEARSLRWELALGDIPPEFDELRIKESRRREHTGWHITERAGALELENRALRDLLHQTLDLALEALTSDPADPLSIYTTLLAELQARVHSAAAPREKAQRELEKIRVAFGQMVRDAQKQAVEDAHGNL